MEQNSTKERKCWKEEKIQQKERPERKREHINNASE